MRDNIYFTKQQDFNNRILFLTAQLLFTIGSLVNYYYIDPFAIKNINLIMLFDEFLGSLCMTLFQYRTHWFRGTIIMIVATSISAFVFLHVLLMYFKNKNTK